MRERNSVLFTSLFITILSFSFALYGLDQSGTLWPDGPRYANGAAMINDWLHSGQFLHPLEFAKQNYFQYPAFSIPYHPPAYPGILGLVFFLTDESYVVARCFVACCFAVCGLSFYAIMKHFKTGNMDSLLCVLLFITTPEMVKWSRDTMSEIPSLCFILLASYFYLQWLNTSKNAYCLTAFLLAEIAFLSRVTTIGVIPAWIVFSICSGHFKKLRTSKLLILCIIVFLIMNVAWLRFISKFAQFELNADGRESGSLLNYQYFLDCMPELLANGTGLMMLLGLITVYMTRSWSCAIKYWSIWLISFTVFKLVTSTSPETRYFILAIPAFAGCAVAIVSLKSPYRIELIITLLAILANTYSFMNLPSGLIGYEQVASQMSELDEPGNIMLAVPHDQDLIFRFRCKVLHSDRLMIRADRTLTIRLADYAKKETKVIAQGPEKVLDVIRKGRIRYVILLERFPESNNSRLQEVNILHETIDNHPMLFSRVGKPLPLYIGFAQPGYWRYISVWKYRGELPPGAAELSVPIPTAEMELKPK